MRVDQGDADDEVPPGSDPRVLQEELQRTKAALAEARNEAAEAKAQLDVARHAEGVLSDFAASAPAALWVADARSGQGVYVSPGVGSLLCAAPEEVLPEAGRWLELVHPDDRPAVRARFEALLRGEAAEVAYRILPRGEAAAGATSRAAAAWVSDIGFPIADARGRVRRVAGFAHAAEGGTGEEGLRRLLLAELNHRVRNALAAVQSVAAQTARVAPDPRSFWEAFAGRLRAMARAHDMLAGRGWPEGVELRALVEAELAPYLHAAGPSGPTAEIDGPSVQLRPAMAVALALALHELATNAARHGALSVPTGRVRVHWSCIETSITSEGMHKALTRSLRLEWLESGGPTLPERPARRGFGARLLTGALPTQLGGHVSLEFAGSGLHAVLEAALSPKGEPLYAPQADPAANIGKSNPPTP
ncbi:sensor histidine kinase [Dankookia sp. P2]|uniref:sensor histidine kinase n=1 Tax=Dankookia sp. P2 TaxID=3423955 RepID=UPI003D673A73